MKKILGIFAVALSLLTACDELNELDSNAFVLVNEADANQEVEYKGGKIELEFTALEDWTAEADSKWCIVTPRSGTPSDVKVNILIDKNKTSEDRVAKVTFRSASSELVINIVQHNEGYVASDTTGVASSFVFMLTHQMKDFKMPAFGGNFNGQLFWGDGDEEDYTSSVTGHTYSNTDQKTVVMLLNGNKDDFEVSFDSLKGILKIDLSGI